MKNNLCEMSMNSGRVKVLQAEDDSALRTAIKMILGGFDVLAAANLAQALQLLSEHPDIALGISDHQMPGGNGLDLRRSVRERGELPFLLISASRPPDMDEELPFMKKPFAVKQFRTTVAMLLALGELIMRRCPSFHKSEQT